MKLIEADKINPTHCFELSACFFELEQVYKYPLEIFYNHKHLITLTYDSKNEVQSALRALRADHVSFISNELKCPVWRLGSFKTWLQDHNVEIKR